MAKKRKSCKEFVEGIEQGGSMRNKTVEELYTQFFGFVYKFTKDYEISYEDMLGVYNEAIALFVAKVDTGKFNVFTEGSCSSFIYQVCKNQCNSWHKKNEWRKNTNIEDFEENPFDKAENLEDQFKILDQDLIHNEIEQNTTDATDPIVTEEGRWKDHDIGICFQKLNPTCQQLLLLWAEGYSLDEIVDRMESIRNKNSASVTKFNCLKALRECVENRRKNR